MLDVTFTDIADRLPIPVTEEQKRFIEVRITDALDLIREAFMRRGRDFERELDAVSWLPLAAKRIVIEMVAAAVTVGPHVGARSLSSTTGPQSDAVTYTDAGQLVRFSGVGLTDEMLFDLGLVPRGPRGRFPSPLQWPEVHARRRWN